MSSPPPARSSTGSPGSSATASDRARRSIPGWAKPDASPAPTSRRRLHPEPRPCDVSKAIQIGAAVTTSPDFPRNAGLPFDASVVEAVRVNTPATLRRAATLPGRRSVKKDWQAAWLARAVSMIDLTTLAGDDTPGRVRRLCAKALSPVRADLLDAIGLPDLTAGAVCVYHEMVPVAVEAVAGRLPVAAVSTGFPAGLTPFDLRLREIERSVAAGATEI